MHSFLSEMKTMHFEVSTYCQECLEKIDLQSYEIKLLLK